MNNIRLCISIPDELQQFQKVSDIIDIDINTELPSPNFGVKVVKNEHGEINYTAFYSDSGELIKRIYYNGSSVACIKYYRFNKLHYEEFYNNGKIYKKITFDKEGNTTYITRFEYNKLENINSITKFINNNRYKVEYGYDELKRVNNRKIIVNSILINEQHYKYDILDRLVEYSDSKQCIKVQKINPKNELIHYTINDRAGNQIIVINKYLNNDYIGTEIELNGHKTTIVNKAYTDNVFLKKPYTSEDDLELIISSMLKKTEFINTKRKSNTDITNTCIDNKLKYNSQQLPISIRKINLLNSA